ncbi:MAG: hypothetical protein IJV44_12360 [Prevotella sp.]|nr:hypothetical protein [Prevotella sp.]
MKKFLLFAAAAIVAVSVNAQTVKKHMAGKPVAKNQVAQPTNIKKYEVAGAKFGVSPVLDKTTKQFRQLSAKEMNSLKPIKKEFKAARAGAVQELYNGSGTLRSTNEATQWEMAAGTGTLDGETVTLLQNVIPDIFGFEGGVVVEYTLNEGNIVIQPQLVASFPSSQAPSGTYYLFLESATSNDGSITLTLDDEGNITGTYSIIYSVYPNEVYNYDEWVGTYDGIQNAQYVVPGREVAPIVSFEPSTLVLFNGLGLNGYSFNNNLAITGANTNTVFANRTTNPATAWNWTAYDAAQETDENPEVVLTTGTDKDFSLALNSGDIARNVTLIGKQGEKVSDPFTFGVGKSLNSEGTGYQYSDCYLYGGGGERLLNNETPAILTRQDPDGDLTFYTNWATPDKASNAMSKIYIYHEKPATPLFITGVTLPLVSFTAQDDFNLHIKLVKVTYPANATRPTLGEVIAEGDATTENINADFDMGLTGIEIPLYKSDESGLSEDLDYLFIEDEFVIVIEGWNNGTFSGVLGSQDAPLDNARTSTWFEMAGEDGTMYAYTSWKTSLFVGLMGATYGYLDTEDSKDITIPEAGGTVSIKVHPMYCNDEADETGSKTRLWLDEYVEDNDIPEWLQVGFANEDYDETFTFDLVFQAEALPAGTEGRQATITFMQEGAKLEVTVTQGTVTGINVTTKTVKTGNTPAYNLAGQRVNKNFKGIVVKDGKKFVVK